jgi:release factor glutamine methyltransferase
MELDSQALLAVGCMLQQHGYAFVTVTPETHRRVDARAAQLGAAGATSLRDVFGWNRPFERGLLPAPMFQLLQQADALEGTGPQFRSRVRFSTLGDRLFVHSSFPTTDPDAVFFGPDTYRFCALLQRWAPRAWRVLDVGCGSGAGGISIADRAQQLVLSDINHRALRLTAVNAELAAVAPEMHSDVLNGVAGSFDLIIANPPYMLDVSARTYRDGGGSHGEALSARIVREALPRLAAGGMLIVYTGAAIVDAVDTFHTSVRESLALPGASVTYEELDPDVFGEELETPNYAAVERIAAVGLRVCVR